MGSLPLDDTYLEELCNETFAAAPSHAWGYTLHSWPKPFWASRLYEA